MREPRRITGCGAPAPLFILVLLISFVLLLPAGCGQRQSGEPSSPPSGKKAPAPAAAQKPSPLFSQISVFLTDARTNAPVADAEVIIGTEQFLPEPLPKEYGDDPTGLYVSKNLPGGSYFFRVRRAGYRSLAGKLAVPPVPERVDNDVPLTLELLEVRESGEAAPSIGVLVLWRAHRKEAAPRSAPHPVMPKPAGVSPHGSGGHPPVAPPAHPPRQ